MNVDKTHRQMCEIKVKRARQMYKSNRTSKQKHTSKQEANHVQEYKYYFELREISLSNKRYLK